VLVLRALGLGDLLTGVPALRALRRAHPGAHVQLAAPAALAELALATGAVDDVVDVSPLARLPARVAGAELAVNLHGRGPQSTEVLRASGPRRLLAYGEDGRVWRADEHEVDRWCRLLVESGIPADRTDLHVDVAPAGPPAVLIHPGAAAASRRWPADRWAAVARGLAAGGEQVLITGGPDEVTLAAEIAAGAGLPDDAVVAGRTGLLELAGLVAAARLVVAPDTGVGHLATATGTASVLLFGPTPPRLWGPPPERARHRVLWAGRSGDPLGSRPDPGLLCLTPEMVLLACAEALAGQET